jgi:isopenicillin N synthase-like dioxygenase
MVAIDKKRSATLEVKRMSRNQSKSGYEGIPVRIHVRGICLCFDRFGSLLMVHLDFGTVSILWPQPVTGLQVLTEDGKWQFVRYVPNALVSRHSRFFAC